MNDKAKLSQGEAPSISVVVPNYNHGHLIGRSIAGIASQGIGSIEIIIIDDASTDDSAKIISEMGERNGSIRFIRNDANLGAIDTIQKGIGEARGEFICFVAADDCIAPGFLPRAIEMLTQHAQAGLYCGDVALYNGETGRYLGLRPPVIPSSRPCHVGPESYLKLLGKGDNHIVTGAAVFRREAVVEAGGMDAQLGAFADAYLARKIALKSGFVYDPRVNSQWYIFSSGVSTSTAIDVEKAERTIEIAEARLKTPPFPPWYGPKYGTHLRFAMSRAALNQPDMIPEVALRVGLQARSDRTILRTLLKVPNKRASRFLAIAWLWFRLRPYRVRDLLWTYLARRFVIYGKSGLRKFDTG